MISVQESNNSICNAMTIDVEDSINLIMRDRFGIDQPPTDRVYRNTIRILELFSDYETKATFFVLGEVAEYFPGLIREIVNEGHEIGVHGYSHIQFFKMDREQAFQELTRAKKIIEDTSGIRAYGHRAPAFSVFPETSWALEVIAEAGFLYDSSIVPFKGKRYGWPEYNQDIHTVQLNNGLQLIEAPLPTVKLLWKRMPVCGGGYLRHFPYLFSKWALERVSVKRPVIVYMHPYEIDTSSYPQYIVERMKEADYRKMFTAYMQKRNKKTVEIKLKKYLSDFSFNKLSTIIGETLGMKINLI